LLFDVIHLFTSVNAHDEAEHSEQTDRDKTSQHGEVQGRAFKFVGSFLEVKLRVLVTAVVDGAVRLDQVGLLGAGLCCQVSQVTEVAHAAERK